MAGWEWRSIGRDRRMRTLGTLLVAAIGIGLVAAWLSRGEFRGRYAVPILEADHPAASTRQNASPPARPMPKVQPRRAVLPPSALPAGENGPSSASDVVPDDSDRMARAIEKAVRKALRRGEPVRWHKAGESGYVVASEARVVGDRTCRNVSATIDREDGRTQSSAHLWCTADDEDWAPAE